MATTGDRPRFRQDKLIAEAIEDNNARFVDVLDPDSGTLFRFYDVEYALACGMDGQRDVNGIVRWAEEELGLKPNPKEVRNVIATLGDLGFIDGAGAPAITAPPEVAPTRPTPPPTPAVSRAPTPQPPQPAHAAAGGQGKSTSRWDQPTAMGDSDQYLQKGVVAGGRQAAKPAPEVELGGAGARVAKSPEMPRAPELELGKPGTAQTARAAVGRGEDIPLGAPGRSDVDLAADMPMSRADVKEAVKQSQVHRAVEPPPEPARPQPAKEAPRPVEARPEPRPEPKPAPRPEPRPQPPVETRREPAKPAVSPVLLAALVLAVLALGGYALYKFVFAKKKDAEPTAVVPKTEPRDPGSAAQPPPPPPAVETAKLATDQPAPEELKSANPGTVQTIVANDTMVKEGEPIAKLAGFRGPEAQLTQTQKALAKAKTDLENAQKARDAAQTANDKNALAAAEKKAATADKAIADNEHKLATQQAALDKLIIKAPAAGKVTAVAKANAKVTPTDVIATIARDPVLIATFKSAPSTPVATRVLLATKEGAKLSCSVAAADPGALKVACPKDAAPEGTEVTFVGVDPSPPPEAPKGETPPTEAPKGEAPKGEAPKGDAPKGDAPKEPKATAPKRPRPPAEKKEPAGGDKPVGGDKPAGGGEPAGSGT